MMRALGVGLVVLMWTVCLVGTINVLHDWIRDHFASDAKGAWVTRLAVMGSIKRLR